MSSSTTQLFTIIGGGEGGGGGQIIEKYPTKRPLVTFLMLLSSLLFLSPQYFIFMIFKYLDFGKAFDN